MLASFQRLAEVSELLVPSAVPNERAERERALVRAHMSVIWRFLRRLGCSPEDADDATQEVFVIAVRKLDQIEPDRERAFLYGTAMRLASRQRRSTNLRAQKTARDVEVDELGSRAPSSDELFDRKEARATLDAILDRMAPDLRTTFTLYELEELTMAEIAELTGAPMGTVASRLRRAREYFQDAVRRFQISEQR